MLTFVAIVAGTVLWLVGVSGMTRSRNKRDIRAIQRATRRVDAPLPPAKTEPRLIVTKDRHAPAPARVPAPAPEMAVTPVDDRGRSPSSNPSVHPIPEWATRLPHRVIALDTETTGLTERDRIITLGLIAVDAPAVGSHLPLQGLHLVFDPVRKIHPGAQAINGWDDWTVRHQDRFSDHAHQILGMLQTASVLIAHNIDFDLRFLQREFRRCGIAWQPGDTFCTLQHSRAHGFSPAKLENVAERLGLPSRQGRHNAIEDAWLSFSIYVCLALDGPSQAPADNLPTAPSNFRAPPPRPEGPLPRRQRRPQKPKPTAV